MQGASRKFGSPCVVLGHHDEHVDLVARPREVSRREHGALWHVIFGQPEPHHARDAVFQLQQEQQQGFSCERGSASGEVRLVGVRAADAVSSEKWDRARATGGTDQRSRAWVRNGIGAKKIQ